MKHIPASIITVTDKLWGIEGELSFNTVKALLNQSKKLFLVKTKHIEIDLSKVKYSDSSGLTLLIEWQRLAKKHKKTITFKNLPEQLTNIAKLAKLDDILQIEAS